MEAAAILPEPRSLNFVAIDFETANDGLESICQVGIARFVNSQCVEQSSWVVDPEGEFLPRFVSIHGIEAKHAQGAPLFPDVFHDYLLPAISGQVVVSHGHFDRSAMLAACARYGLEAPDVAWLNSIKLARRTWPNAREIGLRLADLARRFDISFRHHDAGEDARAAGQIVVEAANALGLDMAGCLARCELTVSRALSGQGPARARAGQAERAKYRTAVLREASELQKAIETILALPEDQEDKPLEGQSVAFTGTLSVPRALAQEAVRRLGGTCTDGPTKDTTVFVAGTPDPLKNKAGEKSSKFLKAERLIQKGQDIRILREDDFVRWLVGCWAE